MRIISKFHDYYDTVMGTGIDKTLIYKREQKYLDLSELPSGIGSFADDRNMPFNTFTYKREDSFERLNGYISRYKVLFCGQLHNIIQVQISHFHDYENHLVIAHTSIDSLIGTLTKYGHTQLVKELTDPKSKKPIGWWDRRHNAKACYTEFLNQPPERDHGHIHIEYNSPIVKFVSTSALRNQFSVELNPNLRDLGFVHVVDPYTAYQELSMFLSGVMACEMQPPVTISDEHRKQRHGFDGQSFKTRKGSKKPRRTK